MKKSTFIFTFFLPLLVLHTSANSDADLGSVDKLTAVNNNTSPYDSSFVVKGMRKKLRKKLTGESTSEKEIPLKRKGDYFVLPIEVGTPKLKGESRHMYSVKLDVSSPTTVLFGPGVQTALSNHRNFQRIDSDGGKYQFYFPERSSTHSSFYKGVEYSKPLPDGNIYKGTLMQDTFRVGGIEMKDTLFALVQSRSSQSPNIMEPIDITGFDGSLGLGVRSRHDLISHMALHSKTMKKTETFSIYICSGGQAGQLQLGGVDNTLLKAGSKVKYVPVHEFKEDFEAWAVKVKGATLLNGGAIKKERVAIIDSASPFITVPQKDILELFKHDQSLQFSKAVEREEDEVMLTGSPLPTIPEEVEAQRIAVMVKCSNLENMGTLTLEIGDTPVSITGKDMLRAEAADQVSYRDMCELIFTVHPNSSQNQEWELGIPFLQAAGMTVFDKKNMEIGFAPVTHSDKVCGPKK